jgi:hypothetical protein
LWSEAGNVACPGQAVASETWGCSARSGIAAHDAVSQRCFVNDKPYGGLPFNFLSDSVSHAYFAG